LVFGGAEEDGFCKLSVAENGSGIEEGTAKRLKIRLEWNQKWAKAACSSYHCQNKIGGPKMRSQKPIMLVEDDSVDAMTVKRAIKKDLNVTNELVHVANGQEALDYLRAEGKARPCIILLDLNMPKMNGIEFLKVMKSDEALKEIPVVVLTTSKQEQDKVESFKLGVAGYMLKAVDYKRFVETIRAIDLYWTLSELPSNGN
jgi:CheY-like chemotaxis protein